MNLQTLALAFLAAAAIGGVAWVFLYPVLSGERKAEGRRASVAKAEPVAVRQNQRDARSRRARVCPGQVPSVDSVVRVRRIRMTRRATNASTSAPTAIARYLS